MIELEQRFEHPIAGLPGVHEHGEYTYGYKNQKNPLPSMECGKGDDLDLWTCVLHDGGPSGQSHMAIDGFSIDPSIVGWIESGDGGVKFSFNKPFKCSDDADPEFKHRRVTCVAARDAVYPPRS